MEEQLGSILRDMRADALVREAQAIRDYPECRERIDAAEKHVREARLQRILGNLSAEEEHRIFSLLNFAMPEDTETDDEC